MTQFETLAVHESGLPTDSFGSVVSPICLSTTFTSSNQSSTAFEYTRTNNPTRNRLESCLAQLENARYCLTMSSGMAAIDVTFQSAAKLFSNRLNIIASHDLYGGSHRYLDWVQRFPSIQVRYVNLCGVYDWTELIKKDCANLIWLESCTNPLLYVPDIKAITEDVRRISSECYVIVDNTFFTPYLMNPLDLGADVVLHSVTKYINGHCDVLMGATMTNNLHLYQAMKFFQNSIGNVPSPFDCYLVLRGVKTLPLRMKKHSENAMQISLFLQSHPAVDKVMYPGKESGDELENCQRQLIDGGRRGYGGMISVLIKGNIAVFLKSLRVFLLAESLGGVESLVDVPASMTHSGLSKEVREKLGIRENLMRLSIGIENVNDLINDLDQALISSMQTQ